MSFYKIQYFTSNYGGTYDEEVGSEIIEGTYEEVVAHVEAKDTGWGFNYKVGGRRHGEAVVTEVPVKVKELEEQIAYMQGELAALYSHHNIWTD